MKTLTVNYSSPEEAGNKDGSGYIAATVPGQGDETVTVAEGFYHPAQRVIYIARDDGEPEPYLANNAEDAAVWIFHIALARMPLE